MRTLNSTWEIPAEDISNIMKSTLRFRVEAPVEAIYAKAFAPDKWMRFFKGYRALESVDPNWPEQGSSITQMKQTIVDHEHGRRLRIHEELLSGWWIDDIEMRFDSENGVTNVTVISNPTSKILLVKPLLLLMWPFGVLMTRSAMKRFKAMIESSKTA